MVLDSEPKPLSKNIVIQIPSKDTAAPVAETKTETVQDEAPKEASRPLQVATVDIPQKSVIPPAPVETVVAPKASKPAVTRSEEKTETKPAKKDSKPAEVHTAGNDEAARAMAILGGSDAATTSPAKSTVRIVLQVGAFATQEKVNELQNKLSSAGIKSFTQKVATSSGDKIRVRVGPFSDRETAEKMKAQVDKLGINGSLITL
jgi:DedD protein